MRFSEQAFLTLEQAHGKWHCLSCWASAARLTAPPDLDRLRTVARDMLDWGDPAARWGGWCDLCARDVDGFRVRRRPQERHE